MAAPLVRPAVLADREAIAAFTTATFDWGDYVADEFAEWLDDPETAVAVACLGDDRPVAIARVKMLSPREGWLSAARVHPDHRRHGLGSVLNDWCVDWIRSRGGEVARLQIEDWNEAAHNQVVRLGYRPVTEVTLATREISTSGPEPATNGGKRTPSDERLDRAPRAEAELAFVAWSAGELARATRGMFAVGPWEWRGMRPDDAGRGLWMCPSGWVLVDDEREEMTARWVVCTPDDAERLLRALVDLAHERQASRLGVVAPRLPWMMEALEFNGLESHPSRIYEKPTR